MSDEQWKLLFDILTEIVYAPDDKTWGEKANIVRQKAKDNDATIALEEFVSWFW